MISRSRSPWRMARTSAAHSSRSSRVAAKKRPLGIAPRQWPERPTRCSATAMARGELIWTTRSTVPISIPSSSEAVATSTLTSPSFNFRLRCEAQFARQAAVMRGDVVFANPLAQLMRDPLRQPPGVDEDQRGAMLLDQFHQAVVNLVPHLVGGDRAQLAGRDFHREIELALVSDIHDRPEQAVRCRSESERLLRSASGLRKARCVPADDKSAPPAAPAKASGARRACRRRPRGFHRR